MWKIWKDWGPQKHSNTKSSTKNRKTNQRYFEETPKPTMSHRSCLVRTGGAGYWQLRPLDSSWDLQEFLLKKWRQKKRGMCCFLWFCYVLLFEFFKNSLTAWIVSTQPCVPGIFNFEAVNCSHCKTGTEKLPGKRLNGFKDERWKQSTKYLIGGSGRWKKVVCKGEMFFNPQPDAAVQRFSLPWPDLL